MQFFRNGETGCNPGGKKRGYFGRYVWGGIRGLFLCDDRPGSAGGKVKRNFSHFRTGANHYR